MTVEAPAKEGAAPAAAAPAPAAAAAAPAADTKAAPAPAKEGAAAEGKPAAAATEGQAKPGSLLGDAKAPTKPGAEKVPGDAPKVEKTANGAPEKYTDFTLPEGMKLDEKMSEKFSTTARDLGLSQEAAQKLVTLQAESVLADNKARSEWFANQVAEWRKEAIAVLGPKHQEELAFAGKALDRFGTPELRKMLTETGMGEHPLLVQAWVKAGKAIAEDPQVEGRGGGQSDPVEETKRALFPSMYKQK